ncbi:protein ALP1-like [Melanaphis sacchari]|uniref:protein ALP1-like n=1 Tax=Melanaphis sacchari TaxID=742174 RepID=UPI000DC14537|nr:protein ALP1-like [Melanaphis sacchari]
MESLVAEACAVLSGVLTKQLKRRLTEIDKFKLKRRRKRRWWVRQWIQRRNNNGGSTFISRELRNENPEDFKNILRLSDTHFDFLLNKIQFNIQKLNTTMREAIPADTKLKITLRYLATGDSFKSLEYFFRVPKSTISKFLPEVCTEIYAALAEFIEVPSTRKLWDEIEQNFQNRWNFPRCIGAMDGKHILIKAPPKSGTEYYNYKHQYSIILLALVDHNYCFTYIDVGANGKASDAGVFRESSLFEALENNTLNTPENAVIVADDAFPLKTYLLKPYSRRNLTREQAIFNYRLSRARRISENAFGILVSKFRIFEKQIPLIADKVDKIVLACCAIHNWLRKTSQAYLPPGLIDHEDYNYEIINGTWRQNQSCLTKLVPTNNRNACTDAKKIRDDYCAYFNGEGAVPWQWKLIK